MRKLGAFVVVLLILGVLAGSALAQRWGQQPADGCRTPLGEAGRCVSLRQCPEVPRLFERLPLQRATEYSATLRNICGRRVTADNYPVLCCARALEPAATPNPETITTPLVSTPTTTTTTTTTPPPPSTTTTTTTTTALPPSSIDAAIFRLTEAARCRGPQQEAGWCRPLENCTQLYNALRDNQTNLTLQAYLRDSHRTCNGSGTLVCCPAADVAVEARLPTSTAAVMTSPPAGRPSLLPSEEDGCGFVRQNMPRVVGGQDAQLGAWPWVALIGYNRYSLQPFRCGGTLVSARHVISAAHCVRSDLSFVRLGEFDLGDEMDLQHLDIDVAQVKQHPGFASGRNVANRFDVAVLQLASRVTFTDLIYPVCMPTTAELLARSYTGFFPYVVGWGKTLEGGNSSQILQQLQIPILENAVCERQYSALGRLRSAEQFDASVLCAGVLSGGKDTCQGDSGGPLMIPEPYKGIVRYYLIGVVSYGVGCGRVGVPGVYTSTRYFMDWILQIIAEMS